MRALANFTFLKVKAVRLARNYYEELLKLVEAKDYNGALGLVRQYGYDSAAIWKDFFATQFLRILSTSTSD